MLATNIGLFPFTGRYGRASFPLVLRDHNSSQLAILVVLHNERMPTMSVPNCLHALPSEQSAECHVPFVSFVITGTLQQPSNHSNLGNIVLASLG